MGKFVIINIILKALENAMETENYDLKAISAEGLGIDKALWKSIMVLIIENGYVEEAFTYKSEGKTYVDITGIRISLKGLEYLYENDVMRRASRLCEAVRNRA